MHKLRSIVIGAALTLLGLSSAWSLPGGLFYNISVGITYQTPAYVQGSSTTGGGLTNTYIGAQSAGDLNVVAIGWEGNTVTLNTISDIKGNTYSPVATVIQGTIVEALYYAPNIAAAGAGANTVTVTFTGSPMGVDIRAAEYSGVATSSPLDVAPSAGTGASGTALTTGSANTTQAVDLLVGTTYAAGNSSAGTGYTQRILSPDGSLVEDKVTSTTGSYTVTATQSISGAWIIQGAYFKAAPGFPSPGTGLLAYLNSLRGVNVLTGGWGDHFAGTCAGTYGCFLDEFFPTSGATPANITVANCASSSSITSCTAGYTDTGKAPAILSIQQPTGLSLCGGGTTRAQAIAVASGYLTRGGIVQISWDMPSPTQYNTGTCAYNANGTEFATATSIIIPGTTGYNTYMYGCSTCTAGSPGANGGVYNLAQDLKALPAGHKVILRLQHEGNLSPVGNAVWVGTCGTVGNGTGYDTNAKYITLFQQTVTYLRSLGVNNILVEYNANTFGGCSGNGTSQNDPGPSYRDVVSCDLYGPTTQANVISNFTNGSTCWPYLQGLNLPVLVAEAGVAGSSNASVNPFTYSNAIWGNGIQAGASNVVAVVVWNQNYCLGGGATCQLNASGLFANALSLGQLPVITNALWLFALPWRRRQAANDDEFEKQETA